MTLTLLSLFERISGFWWQSMESLGTITFLQFCNSFFFTICVDISFSTFALISCFFRNSEFLNTISVICCYPTARFMLLFNKAVGFRKDVWIFEFANDIFLFCNIDGFLTSFFKVVTLTLPVQWRVRHEI